MFNLLGPSMLCFSLALVGFVYPGNFNKKEMGCFIWKDKSGTWKIECLGLENAAVSGSILSKETISLCPQLTKSLQCQQVRDDLIVFEGTIYSKKAGLSFRSKGGWFDIDIVIDEHHHPGLVFFGEKCKSPPVLPLRVLDNAPAVSPCQDIKDYLSDRKDDSLETPPKYAQSTTGMEDIPDPKTSNEDKRYKSDALKLPDDKKGWPPIQPPKIAMIKRNLDPADPKYKITVIYDVAKDEMRVIKDPDKQ